MLRKSNCPHYLRMHASKNPIVEGVSCSEKRKLARERKQNPFYEIQHFVDSPCNLDALNNSWFNSIGYKEILF